MKSPDKRLLSVSDMLGIRPVFSVTDIDRLNGSETLSAKCKPLSGNGVSVKVGMSPMYVTSSSKFLGDVMLGDVLTSKLPSSVELDA